MKITKWLSYGTLFCLYMVEKQDLSSAAELAEECNIPKEYAQQILHRLKKAGIVRSFRGPTGGYKLALSPEEVTLKEIINAVEGEVLCSPCDLGRVNTKNCAIQKKQADVPTQALACPLSSTWTNLQIDINNSLSKYSLAYILAEGNQSTTQD